MSARNKSRFSTRQAGWIAVGIFAAWVVFLLVPTPRKPKPPASNELPPVAAQSKLESVGLTNNPDWYGLPGFFAVWADTVDWSENQTRFAYWNPGASAYTYFFEAVRKDAGIYFRAISAQEAGVGGVPVDGGVFIDSEQLETRKPDSPTHPFVFSVRIPQLKRPVLITSPGQPVAIPEVKLPGQSNAEPKH